MCANFKPITLQQLASLNWQEPQLSFPEDIYPTYDAPLYFQSKKSHSGEWRLAKFGLVPQWAEKGIDFGKYTYNARTETVATLPSFKHAWEKSQFALIPVDTIFEPRYFNDSKASQRWGIYRKDRKPFTVAAIYEYAKINGQEIRSFSMLTINATHDPLMSQFHKPEDEKRSIIVIDEENRRDWLNCTNQNAHEFFKHMSSDFTAEYMPRSQKIDKQHDLF